VADEAPLADVRAERVGRAWRVLVAREGLVGLDSANAAPSRSDEAAFFVSAFERRAVALERLVHTIVARHHPFMEQGQPPAPVPHVLIAEDLLRMGQGVDSGATPESLQALVHRLVEGKALETPRGLIPLADLVAIPE
jgi:DNA-directed RNA polymerase specialized sigma54-like protein